MRFVSLLAATAATASPALAHGNTHVHPHGIEAMLALIAVLTALGIAYFARR